MILLNMGVSVHSEQAESETGRELRSATKLRSRYPMGAICWGTCPPTFSDCGDI